MRQKVVVLGFRRSEEVMGEVQRSFVDTLHKGSCSVNCRGKSYIDCRRVGRV